MTIDRRKMLGLLAAGGAGVLLPNALLPKIALGAYPDISLVKGPDPAANTREAVKSQGGMGRFVSKGDVVVIKPNMGFGNPPIQASTTEPDVVRALAEMALQAGAKRVLVFDNPCHNANAVMDVCGVRDRLKGLQDTFVYIIKQDRFFREVVIPNAKVLTKTQVAVDILDADTIINVPCAKAHSSSLVTFSMKNWMGVVWDRKPFHGYMDLHQGIAEIASYLKAKLTVLDATRVLETHGPGGPGNVLNMQSVLAGTDFVAMDAYATTLAKWDGKGYRPDQIPHIVHAHKLGLGKMSLDKINVVKTSL